MVSLGYALLTEEHPPLGLVENARKAEEAGFSFANISDHYHPWTTQQGQAGFVWGVIGAIAARTERLVLGTAVTCPTVRIHPAIIAQAAATVSMLMPGRFFLGVGTGERLNEHILGDPWPATPVRLEMLDEAIEVIRTLWQGGVQHHHGLHYEVDSAQIFSLPEQLPPIFVAASGEMAAELAGEQGDGLIATSPQRPVIEAFEQAGGQGKPKLGQMICGWARSEQEGRRLLREQWPNAAIGGDLGQELALPSDFEAAAKLVREDDLANIPAGPDPQVHIDSIQKYIDAGFDHISVHQVGPDQEAFIRFYAEEVMPQLDLQPPRLMQGARQLQEAAS